MLEKLPIYVSVTKSFNLLACLVKLDLPLYCWVNHTAVPCRNLWDISSLNSVLDSSMASIYGIYRDGLFYELPHDLSSLHEMEGVICQEVVRMHERKG